MEAWERRLRWLAANEKTPEQISKDLIICLHELEKLRSDIVNYVTLSSKLSDDISEKEEI